MSRHTTRKKERSREQRKKLEHRIVDSSGTARAVLRPWQRRAQARHADRAAADADPAAERVRAPDRRGRGAGRDRADPAGTGTRSNGPDPVGGGVPGAPHVVRHGLPAPGEPARERGVRGGDRLAVRVRRLRSLAPGAAPRGRSRSAATATDGYLTPRRHHRQWAAKSTAAVFAPLRLNPTSSLGTGRHLPLSNAAR